MKKYSAVQNEKLKRKVGILAIVSAVIIVLLLCFWFFIGNVKTEILDDAVKVKGFANSYTINFDDVEEVYLLSHFNEGSSSMFNSISTHKVTCGNYNNAAFGEYRLDKFNGVNRYIEIKTKSAAYVFNASSAEETEELFKQIYTATDKKD